MYVSLQESRVAIQERLKMAPNVAACILLKVLSTIHATRATSSEEPHRLPAWIPDCGQLYRPHVKVSCCKAGVEFMNNVKIWLGRLIGGGIQRVHYHLSMSKISLTSEIR